jgi:hypothetical protein
LAPDYIFIDNLYFCVKFITKQHNQRGQIMSNQENNAVLNTSGLPRWLADMYQMSISDIIAYGYGSIAR